MFGLDTACLGTGIVIALVFGVLVLLLTIFALAKRYITVPPNKAMIVFGRRYGKNFKIISGGGKFIIPIIERYKFLDLSIHKLTFSISAITVDKVTIALNCVLNAKVGSTEELIRKAAERFLDKQNQIEEIIRDTSEGSARAIIGTLTIESIIEKREEFAGMVIEYAAKDPHLEQTAEICPTDHADFGTFLFGFTQGTGSAVQTVTLSQIQLGFIRPGDFIITQDDDWP